MTIATQSRAEFLKSAERSEVAASAALRARWGDAGGDTAQSSTLILQADAAAEAARQLAFMGNAFAVDSVAIEGVHFDLEGETVRLDYTLPGNPAGTFFGGAGVVDILVIRARVSLAEGRTVIAEGLIAL